MNIPSFTLVPAIETQIDFCDVPEWTWARVKWGTNEYIRFRIGEWAYGGLGAPGCSPLQMEKVSKYRVLEVLGKIVLN